MQNMKTLRELALLATPGPWECHWKLEWSVRNVTLNPYVYVYGGRDGKNASESDSEFIAACSPDAIIALLDERDALRTELEALKAQKPEPRLSDKPTVCPHGVGVYRYCQDCDIEAAEQLGAKP